MGKGRAALFLALGAVLGPAAWAHDPSGGGPDDPEALGRALEFETRLAEASPPADERPLPWLLPPPTPAAAASPGPVRASSRPRAHGAQDMGDHALHAPSAPSDAP